MMEISKIVTEERAVSPVIGVILMVAITVILAAVIGTFVLGLGGQVSESQPNTNIAFNFSNLNDGTADNEAMGIAHEGGSALDAENINVSIQGVTQDIYSAGTVYTDPDGDGTANADIAVFQNDWTGSNIGASDRLIVYETGSGNTDVIKDGRTVQVLWKANSQNSAVLGEQTIS